jgi:hypothetical protein
MPDVHPNIKENIKDIVYYFAENGHKQNKSTYLYSQLFNIETAFREKNEHLLKKILEINQ